jgi:hypothetical protein
LECGKKVDWHKAINEDGFAILPGMNWHANGAGQACAMR